MNNKIVHQPIIDLYSYSAPPQIIDKQLIYKGFYSLHRQNETALGLL